MKKLFIKIIATLACLHGLAWNYADREKTAPKTVSNGFEMVAAFSPAHAKALPNQYKNAEITDLKLSPRVLQFRVNGLPMHIQWIGEQSRMLIFNGRMFSAHDLRSELAFRKAFLAKFGISNKKSAQSLKSFLFSRAIADIDDALFDDKSLLDSTVEVEDDNEDNQTNENGTTFVFEGQEDFTSYLQGNELFKKDSLLGKTRMGKVFETIVGLTTGSSLMALTKYSFMFLGGLAFAMNPAGGFSPGMGLINSIGTPASAIQSPYW